jgi:large subunit ribosomal protein L3
LLSMALQTIFGQKLEQSQKFLEDGTRIPVTRIWVKGNVVVGVRTQDKHSYSSIQLGFGSKKKANKSELGNIKGAKLEKAPKFLKEVRMEEVDPASGEVNLEPGAQVIASEILSEGDLIDVTGTSKGKGYAGVVKRHGFAGGPRTHGQSDRERAPGSIGQTTTPGRVYKGKRMAGRMGHETVTIKNLEVVGVAEDEILIKGLIPGAVNSIVIVKKVGENKKFTPLFSSDAKAMDDEGKKEEEVEAVASDLPSSDDKGKNEVEVSSMDEAPKDASIASSGDAQAGSAESSGESSPSLNDISSPEESSESKIEQKAEINSPEKSNASIPVDEEKK